METDTTSGASGDHCGNALLGLFFAPQTLSDSDVTAIGGRQPSERSATMSGVALSIGGKATTETLACADEAVLEVRAFGSPLTSAVGGGSSKKRAREVDSPRRSVRFDKVEVFSHDTCMAADRVPSEGAGLALGSLANVSIRHIDSFEAVERRGVTHIGAEERRQRLLSISRVESLDRIEEENELVRRQREESALENRGSTPTPLESFTTDTCPADALVSVPSTSSTTSTSSALSSISRCSMSADADSGISDFF